MREFPDNVLPTKREFYALFMKHKGADITFEIQERVFKNPDGSPYTKKFLWYICTFTNKLEKEKLKKEFYIRYLKMPNSDEEWEVMKMKGLNELSPDIDLGDMEDEYKWIIGQRKSIWYDNKKGKDDAKEKK